MDLPVKTKYSLLGFMLTLIILFKYPHVPHEYGKDSFVVHGMAMNLKDLNFAPWLIHPSSAYALYPFSYAPGMGFILTSLSDLTGLSVELTVLLFTIVISLVGAYGMFMFASEVNNRFEVKFIAGFLFAFTPAVTTWTTWTISTRGSFICLMTVLLWALSRTINARHKLKPFLVGLTFLLILPTIHHFALLFPIILLAYLSSYLTVLALEYTGRVSVYFRENVIIASMIIFAFMIFLFYLQASSIDIYAPHLDYFRVWYIYGEKDSPVTMAVNIMVYYGMAMGILMLYGGVGLANILGKIDKTRVEWTLLFLIIFFAVFLADKTYLKMFVVPLFLPLAALGIVALMGKLEYRRTLFTFLTGVLLMAAVYYGSFATEQFSDVRTVDETGYHHYMDEGPYNTAIYLRHTVYQKDGPIAIHNDAVDKRRISGISGIPMLYLEENQVMVVFPDILDEVDIKKYSIQEMYFEHHDHRYYVDWANSSQKGYDDYHYIVDTYWNNTRIEPVLQENKVQWAIVYTYFPEEHGKSSHPFVNEPSRFFTSLPEKRYNIYENDYERIYFLVPII